MFYLGLSTGSISLCTCCFLHIVVVVVVLQPELIDELIIEDIAPARARSTVVSGFPEYIAAMKAVHFDQQLESISHVRKAVGSQISATFPVCVLHLFVDSFIEQLFNIHN